MVTKAQSSSGWGREGREGAYKVTDRRNQQQCAPCEITEREFQMSHHKNMEDEWQGNAA